MGTRTGGLPLSVGAARVQLRLLGGFDLRVDDEAITVPASTRRVVAFLALRERPVSRCFVAGNLWLDKNDERATANLRSALWRLPRVAGGIVRTSGGEVWLSDAVQVDTRRLTAGTGAGDLDAPVPTGPLLPDWHDDWLVLERERLRHLQLGALEHRVDQLIALGRLADAVEAAWAAITMEPLRESSHRCLVRALLAGGNTVDALRHYRFFARHLADEIGLAPSPAMEALVAELLPAAAGATTR